MSISAVANSLHFSNGDMTRPDQPGTAEFDPGFAGLPGFEVSLVLNVTGVTTGTVSGDGQLMIRDADGDALTADLTGVFSVDGMFTFFNASTSNYVFAGPGSEIDGTAGPVDVGELLTRR